MTTVFSKSPITPISMARTQRLGDLLHRSAKRLPTKTALVFRGTRDSFSALDEVVNRAANALAADGIAKGDRVAILSHNSRAFVILRFALARIGAVMTPINFMLNASEIAFILDHSGAVALIAEDALTATADAAIKKSGGPVSAKFFIPHEGCDTPADWQTVEALFAHANTDLPALDIDADDPVQIMYTSGTEARPKGVLLSSNALYAQYVSCIIDGDMREDDIELHCLPLYHCAQLDCFLTPDLYLGATSILLSGADPAEILATIAAENISKLFCPPTIWIALLRHPDFDKTDLSSLNKGYYGASIMPTEIILELSKRLPAMRLCNFYGQTEMSPLATILKPADQLTKLGSAGRPALNVETRLLDDAQNEVPVGEIGEIVHRSPHLTLGYYNDPEKTDAAFKGGWFHSGDLGRFDEDGYLYVVDRKKDMIKTGGENVASREVEEAIYKHPAISEVAVFGLPHPKWIEAVTAIVVLKAGEALTKQALAVFCREALAGYKRPQNIAFTDSLPKNPSGKVLKKDLRLHYAAEFSS